MTHQLLEVVYRDDHIIAVNKPPGLLTHRSAIDRHETRFAMQMLRDQIGQRVYPVHRLDKPTSGILLFALSRDCARQLSEQFASRQVDKYYLAVVRGFCPHHGVIDHALREKLDKMTDDRAVADKPPQEAVTRFRRLATVELPIEVDRYPQTRYSLVQLHPTTGRKHQLRRHMKHIGHPIIGDSTHGKGVHNRFFADHYGCRRLLLACTGMGLDHPVTGQPLLLAASPGEDFMRVLMAFDWLEQARSRG
ncbi:MAG: tRNA pseudouridine(65) synthase TruC [Xanthomonadales bacterium]|nr:tRNA pseudouridine(65) synthase TruC [Xanthomonadales bacterium]